MNKLCERAQIKLSEDSPHGIIRGYASTFGNLDRAGDIVQQGAYKHTLKSFLENGFLAVAHDWHSLSIGTFKEAKEDEHGLFVEAEFHSTPEAQNARTVARERLDRGKSVSLSIGYRVKEGEQSEEGFLLKELDLFEVSLVTVPANEQAILTAAKHLDLLTGLTFADHSKSVLTAVKDLHKRASEIHSLKLEKGRKTTLNAERRGELEALMLEFDGMMKDIKSLLDSSTPRPAEALRLAAQLQAVTMRVRLAETA